MDFAFLREFQVEHDQLVIKQQNGNIYNLQEKPVSYGTEKHPLPQPQELPHSIAETASGWEDKNKKCTPAPPRLPSKQNPITGLVCQDDC